MNEADFNNILAGALVTAASGAGLFFMKFWRDTRDRLFLAFAVAFFLLAINWLVLAAIIPGGAASHTVNESRSYLYIIRLSAFVVILLGIWDKNRRPESA